MTSEEMERAIGFLLDHHAKVSADIERHSEQIGQLASSVSELTADVSTLTESVKVMQHEMEANRLDTREAIDNLIISNEVTRKLSEDVARLAVGASQRVTGLEHRVTDLESKQ